jgi:hypothetical protein
MQAMCIGTTYDSSDSGGAAGASKLHYSNDDSATLLSFMSFLSSVGLDFAGCSCRRGGSLGRTNLAMETHTRQVTFKKEGARLMGIAIRWCLPDGQFHEATKQDALFAFYWCFSLPAS